MKVIVITGISGSGKDTAFNTLSHLQSMGRPLSPQLVNVKWSYEAKNLLARVYGVEVDAWQDPEFRNSPCPFSPGLTKLEHLIRMAHASRIPVSYEEDINPFAQVWVYSTLQRIHQAHNEGNIPVLTDTRNHYEWEALEDFELFWVKIVGRGTERGADQYVHKCPKPYPDHLIFNSGFKGDYLDKLIRLFDLHPYQSFTGNL